jgi:hypothetical protein
MSNPYRTYGREVAIALNRDYPIEKKDVEAQPKHEYRDLDFSYIDQ